MTLRDSKLWRSLTTSTCRFELTSSLTLCSSRLLRSSMRWDRALDETVLSITPWSHAAARLINALQLQVWRCELFLEWCRLSRKRGDDCGACEIRILGLVECDLAGMNPLAMMQNEIQDHEFSSWYSMWMRTTDCFRSCLVGSEEEDQFCSVESISQVDIVEEEKQMGE